MTLLQATSTTVRRGSSMSLRPITTNTKVHGRIEARGLHPLPANSPSAAPGRDGGETRGRCATMEKQNKMHRFIVSMISRRPCLRAFTCAGSLSLFSPFFSLLSSLFSLLSSLFSLLLVVVVSRHLDPKSRVTYSTQYLLFCLCSLLSFLFSVFSLLSALFSLLSSLFSLLSSLFSLLSSLFSLLSSLFSLFSFSLLSSLFFLLFYFLSSLYFFPFFSLLLFFLHPIESALIPL